MPKKSPLNVQTSTRNTPLSLDQIIEPLIAPNNSDPSIRADSPKMMDTFFNTKNSGHAFQRPPQFDVQIKKSSKQLIPDSTNPLY